MKPKTVITRIIEMGEKAICKFATLNPQPYTTRKMKEDILSPETVRLFKEKFQAGNTKVDKDKRKKKTKGLYIKLSGGPNFLDGGDYTEMIQTRERYIEGLKVWGEEQGFETPLSTEKSPFFWGYGAEIGYQYDRFAFGLEVGLLSRRFTEINTVFFYKGSVINGDWNMDFSALPVLLNLQIEILDFSFLKIIFLGGGGLYMGKYRGEQIHTEDNSICLLEEGKQSSYGFHIGAAAELKIFRNLSFVVESRYRTVIFNGISALSTQYPGKTDETSQEGDLYYYKEKTGEYVGEYAGFNVGPLTKSQVLQRKADLNLNGVALTIGIKFIL